MTWEDAIELGRKVSSPSGGVQYKALFPYEIIGFASSLSPILVDPKTGLAKLLQIHGIALSILEKV
jgi:hypothetical protein